MKKTVKAILISFLPVLPVERIRNRMVFVNFTLIIAAIILATGCLGQKTDSGEVIPFPADDTIVAELPGLSGVIYGSADLKRPLATNNMASMKPEWNSSTGFGTSWSAQWEGYLVSPHTGTVVIKGETNREILVTLGSDTIIGITSTFKKDTSAIRLKKGKYYYFNIKYFQKSVPDTSADDNTFLNLSWRYGKNKMMTIPETAIRHSEYQEGRWLYPGENYKSPFNPNDTTGYTLDPIRIVAPRLASLDFNLPTGGLPVVDGIQTFTVCRADREHPEKAEGLGYTYQHHQDMAVWKGKIYVGWNTCKVDEDTWPSREVYSTSVNGIDWSKPSEMFPQGVSTPLRMYFYLSPNGRMLVIAGLRVSQERLSERDKYGLVVREINADHTLGKVFTLRKPKEEVRNIPEFYRSATDPGFVNACNDLLNDYLYLSQQDYGNLLEPEQKMKWFDPDQWQGDNNLRELASEFGKAMCFFTRKDGVIVGVSKRRWVTLSADGGKSWSQPVRPKSLITGNGKVWGQSTPSGRYYLIYNHDPSKRWPLVLVSGNDGITFRNPCSISPELPEIRYEGKNKDRGLSYHRGLSHWNNDGSLKDNGVWIVYSINKEDIVISRIPGDI